MVLEKSNEADKGKLAFKAGTWYVISSVLVRAIAIITTPIFTRMMSTDEYGTVATFTSWYALLITFCTANLNFSIGRAKIDYEYDLDNYIGSMQLLSAFITILILFISFIFLDPLSKFLELDKTIIILLSVYLLFSPAITFVQNGYRYRYQYKQNVGIAWYVSVSTVVLSLVLMLVTPLEKDISRVMGIVIPNFLLSLVFWLRGIKQKRIHVNLEYWKYGFGISAPLVLHTVCMNILSQSDRIFIQKMWGTTPTAIYSLAYSYGIVISIITNAVSDGWLPWFHDSYHNNEFKEIKKNTKLIVILGCYVGLACIAMAPEAITILGGEKYAEGVYCVPPIVLGVVCQYIYTHYVNIEMHLKKTKYISGGTIFAALTNIVLNYFFIPMFGYVAAAYTTLVSYFLLMIIHFLITRLLLKIKLYDDFFMFVSIIITSCIGIGITFVYSNNIVRYSIVAVGFISFLFIFRNFIIAFINTKFKYHKFK